MLLLLNACGGGGGAPTARAEPPALQGEIFGIFLDVKTTNQPERRKQILIDYVKGAGAPVARSLWRSRVESLVKDAKVPDPWRTTASILNLLDAHAAGKSVAPYHVPDAHFGLVRQVTLTTFSDPMQTELQRRLIDHARLLAPAAIPEPSTGATRPLDLLVPGLLVRQIMPPDYANVGASLALLFEGSPSLPQARQVVYGQMNAALASLVDRSRELAKNSNAFNVEALDKAQTVLETVGKVSDFVFGKIIKGDTAEKVGKTIRTVVQVGSALVRVAGSVFTGGFAGLLTGDLVETVSSLFSLGKSDIVEQKLDELQHAIEHLTGLVEVTRLEMHQRFDVVEARLAVLQRTLNQVFSFLRDSFKRMSEELQAGFQDLERLMEELRTELATTHDDVREALHTLRWFAAKEARSNRETRLSTFFEYLAGARVDTLPAARASFERALVILDGAAQSENFVQSSPSFSSLREMPLWLVTDRSNESIHRLAGMGSLTQATRLLNLPTFEPHHFGVFYVMAAACFDVVAQRPELLPSSTELNSFAQMLEREVRKAMDLGSGLASVLEAGARKLVTNAEATRVEWADLLRTHKADASLRFSGHNSGPGPLLISYLDAPYFDRATLEARIPLRVHDGGFTTATWPPAPRTLPLDEWIYVVKAKQEALYYRRSREGYDWIRLGVALGALRVEERSRSGDTERAYLVWDTQRSFIDDLELRAKHGNRFVEVELLAAGAGLPPQITIHLTSSRELGYFASIYSEAERWGAAYLHELQDDIATALQKNSAQSMLSLKDYFAAAACARYGTELTLEAAFADADFSSRLRQVLDRPALFQESLLNGRQAAQAPSKTAWEQAVIDGLASLLVQLRAGGEDLSAELLQIEFYDELFQGSFARDARELEQQIESEIVPVLRAGSFRFAAVHETREALDRLRSRSL